MKPADPSAGAWSMTRLSPEATGRETRATVRGARTRAIAGLARLLRAGAIAVLVPAAAHAWWNSDWTLREKITLDTTESGAAITDAIGTVPVLLRLADGNFRFASAQADGSDLRFVAEDDKTPLAYHIERFDPVLGEALVWVKVPDVKPAGRTSFWLYYANGGGKVTKADDPKGTYDGETVLVYHFGEHGQPAFDFSGNNNAALNAGTPDDGALVGTGLRLDGRNTVGIPASPSLAVADRDSLTWSAWIKYVAPQPNAVLYSRRDSAAGLLIGVDNGVPYAEVTNAYGTRRTAAGAPLAANSWHHLAVVASSPKVTVYVDGSAYGSADVLLPALTTSALIGGFGTGGAGYAGEIDELQIARVARTAGALKFAAVNQGADTAAKLVSFGAEEQQTSWLSAFKGGYVGIIISSLSTDGWVVIGILGVMSIVSWTVMIRKATHLNRVVRGNAEFLSHWRYVANDLSVLDNGDADHARTMGGRFGGGGRRGTARDAALFRIYQIGVEEIQLRLSAERNGNAKILSGRSLEAIRASLDGGLVRETQQLNSQLVLLTIAISGGPFLGLLGTVIGVMITFAAVAAAGDVNVNAIAPGIAAALAATVAGLGVAIPSLFGYNYLLTRVKAITSDLHVFIDEFVTKLAEFYSEPPDDGGTLPLPFDDEQTTGAGKPE